MGIGILALGNTALDGVLGGYLYILVKLNKNKFTLTAKCNELIIRSSASCVRNRGLFFKNLTQYSRAKYFVLFFNPYSSELYHFILNYLQKSTQNSFQTILPQHPIFLILPSRPPALPPHR